MPREPLTITPLSELTLPALNEFITQLNQRMTSIQTALTKSEGLDGHKPEFFNDVDMQAHTLKNIKAIQFADPITIGALAPFELTKPGDITAANASASMADVAALRNDVATRMLPTVATALDKLRVQMNTILARLK